MRADKFVVNQKHTKAGYKDRKYSSVFEFAPNNHSRICKVNEATGNGACQERCWSHSCSNMEEVGDSFDSGTLTLITHR